MSTESCRQSSPSLQKQTGFHDWTTLRWEPPFVPTLVLEPHPDDETLGAGGLTVKLCSLGVPVTVVALTDGDHAYTDAHNLGEIRVREQTEALHRLGRLCTSSATSA